MSLINFWFIAYTPVQYEILAEGVGSTDVQDDPCNSLQIDKYLYNLIEFNMSWCIINTH